METLRMHPAAFILPRYVKNPFDFAGYRVESEQLIYIALGISHFLPQFYPEPYAFDVERYSPLRQEHKQPGAFAPFSFGEHTCTGARLAEIQMMLIVATLLHIANPQIDPPNYTLKTTLFSKKSAGLTPVDFYIKTRIGILPS
jgi:cytochrome P450